MDEATFRATILRMLRARKPLVWHYCRRSDHCSGTAGFPDLFIVGLRRMIFRELKGDGTPVRLHQTAYGEALMLVGASWDVWRPEDLASGRIEKELGLL